MSPVATKIIDLDTPAGVLLTGRGGPYTPGTPPATTLGAPGPAGPAGAKGDKGDPGAGSALPAGQLNATLRNDGSGNWVADRYLLNSADPAFEMLPDQMRIIYAPVSSIKAYVDQKAIAGSSSGETWDQIKAYIDTADKTASDHLARLVKAFAYGVNVIGLFNVPPPTLTPGVYLVDENPLGPFAGHAGKLALWDGDHWEFLPQVTVGHVIYETVDGMAYRWNGVKYESAAPVARVTEGINFPVMPSEHDLHWKSDEQALYSFHAGKWTAASVGIAALAQEVANKKLTDLADVGIANPEFMMSGDSIMWSKDIKSWEPDNRVTAHQADIEKLKTDLAKLPTSGAAAPIEVLGVVDRHPAPITDWKDGERYIVAVNPFDNGFHGMGNWIVTRDTTEGLGWRFDAPGRPGTVYHVKSTNEFKVWNGHEYVASYTPPSIFMTDEWVSNTTSGDIRFVSDPQPHMEVWNGTRWTRVTHDVFYQTTPPASPAQAVHDNDIWYDPNTAALAVAHDGKWHQTANVPQTQFGGSTWTMQHLAGQHSIWWKQGLDHFEPHVWVNDKWWPAYPAAPPAAAGYDPTTEKELVQGPSFTQADGSNTRSVAISNGVVGQFIVDLGATNIRRPTLFFYSNGGQTRLMHAIARINDEFLGSGTGDSTAFHASSVRFGGSDPAAHGVELRVHNPSGSRNGADDATNILQLSYILKYSVSTYNQTGSIVRVELIGSSGTTVDGALPIRVHANIEFSGLVTGMKLVNDHRGLVDQVMHTYLGGR